MSQLITFLKTLKTITELIKRVVDFFDNRVQEAIDKAYEDQRRNVDDTIGGVRDTVESDKPDEVKDEDLRNRLRNRKNDKK